MQLSIFENIIHIGLNIFRRNVFV